MLFTIGCGYKAGHIRMISHNMNNLYCIYCETVQQTVVYWGMDHVREIYNKSFDYGWKTFHQKFNRTTIQ